MTILVSVVVLAVLATRSRSNDDSTLFTDDFDGGASLSEQGWSDPLSSQAWRLVGKSDKVAQVTANSAGDRLLVTGDRTWQDYTISAQVKPGAGQGGLVARFTSSFNYYSLTVGSARVVLHKTVYGDTSILAQAAVKVDTAAFQQVSLEVVGNSLRGFLNGAAVVQARDKQLVAGRIGLYADHTAQFDHVVADRPANPVPGRSSARPSPSVSTTASPKASIREHPVLVSSTEELAAAMTRARAGDAITLADGEYAIGQILGRRGTATAPIQIKAAHRGKAVITSGQLKVANSAFVTIDGLAWTTSQGLLIYGSHDIRLTRNHFRLTEESDVKWVLVSGAASHHNRIDHNLFEHKRRLGNFITIDGSPMRQSQDDLIDHNYFRDVVAAGPNGMEAVRVGWSGISHSVGRTVIEYNLFEDCDGDPEIVSIKTSGNTARYNTFLASAGVLSQRHGDRGKIYGNFFLGEGKPGTGGVRVFGKDHLIYNNYFEGLAGTGYSAALKLGGGDADRSGPQDSQWRVYRARVMNNTFINNVSNIEIGSPGLLVPVDSTVADNLVTGSQGNLFQEYGEPVRISYIGNIAWPVGSARIGISVAPRSIDVADPLLRQENGVYHVEAGSPVVDAASNSHDYLTEDLDGQRRTGVADVGADELSPDPVRRAPLKPSDVGVDAP